MKYIKTLISALFAVTLLVSVAVAAPSTNAPLVSSPAGLGEWTVSLAGGGSTAFNSNDQDATVVGGEVQIGHAAKLILPLEVGVRQGVGYANSGNSSWLLSTRIYSDVVLVKFGNLQFDAGANVGVIYGNTTLTWVAAPEVVGRLYLKKDVDLFARVEYPFNLNEGKAENRLDYTIGCRIRF